MEVSNNAIHLLQKSLDHVWQKQGVISENIANATTPGYKAKYLTFENELLHSIKNAPGTASGMKQAIDKAKVRTKVSDSEALTLDGNNVNMDSEYVELARAQIQYEYLVQQLNDQFSRLRTVIEGR